MKMTSEMVKSAWASIGYFLYYLDPDIQRIARRLEHLHLKILKKKQSEVFNHSCCLPSYGLNSTSVVLLQG